MANKKKPLKKQKIRNSEYYDMQLALDELYAASVKGQRFCNLVELIKRPENIKLAYRNIRKMSLLPTAWMGRRKSIRSLLRIISMPEERCPNSGKKEWNISLMPMYGKGRPEHGLLSIMRSCR